MKCLGGILQALYASALALAMLLGQGCSNDHEQGRVASHDLVPPGGFYLAAPVAKGAARDCPSTPEPYTGELFFPSKYEGSDSARDKLNKTAAAKYRKLTEDVRNLENGVNKWVGKYLEDGDPEYAECALEWLEEWADDDALLSKKYNHTGKSVRKWALGSISSAYLRLKFSRSEPLAGHGEQSRNIEKWFGKLADQVVRDWNAQPMERRNNHQYWAAWAVMASAVVLDRRDLFDWSVEQYRHGMAQVDAEGYLPLELSRQTRALAYHNYSMGPLMMIAVFAQANGLDLRTDNNGALQRLAERVEQGLHDPHLFKDKTGYPQELEDLQENSRFSWLEPYCVLYRCSTQTNAWRQSLEPLSTYRLGGDVTQLFNAQLP
ncbi:mannuronate-specific alginate lyase [Pseudomonas cavernicola]|uniref:Mannuronate-specific alginate lyase n=1 Tax=Pseudomonas cavernicola TaxID=2320866 RepID=A0A418XB17_9PSED|nr:mannuronate-specific alginate lyase [Pseudomonas cavernicola]RJG09702.1 mannuronate-specific alginate lyase [Pseudomonas cavernicola]